MASGQKASRRACRQTILPSDFQRGYDSAGHGWPVWRRGQGQRLWLLEILLEQRVGGSKSWVLLQQTVTRVLRNMVVAADDGGHLAGQRAPVDAKWDSQVLPPILVQPSSQLLGRRE